MEKRDKKERLWPSYFGFGLFLLWASLWTKKLYKYWHVCVAI